MHGHLNVKFRFLLFKNCGIEIFVYTYVRVCVCVCVCIYIYKPLRVCVIRYMLQCEHSDQLPSPGSLIPLYLLSSSSPTTCSLLHISDLTVK